MTRASDGTEAEYVRRLAEQGRREVGRLRFAQAVKLTEAGGRVSVISPDVCARSAAADQSQP
jgi:hypothetical protein